jgi:hypothetical protein
VQQFDCKAASEANTAIDSAIIKSVFGSNLSTVLFIGHTYAGIQAAQN